METNYKKILIVDDHASILRTLERILKRIQQDCSLASSAEEARRMMEEKTFDLILCDNRMPGDSGMDLMEYVISKYPETAVIMVSGMDDPEVASRALDIGAYTFIRVG